MKKDFDRIDEVFREALNDYQEVPSAHVWKSMSKKLLLLDFARFNLINFPRYMLLYSFTAIISAGIFSYFLISQHGLEHLSEEQALVVAENTPDTYTHTIKTLEEPAVTKSNISKKISNKSISRKKTQNPLNLNTKSSRRTKVTGQRELSSSDNINPGSNTAANVSHLDSKVQNAVKLSSGKENTPETFGQDNEISLPRLEDHSLMASNTTSVETTFVEKYPSSETDNKEVAENNDVIIAVIEDHLETTLGLNSAFTGDSVDIIPAMPADFDPSVKRIPPTRKTVLSVEFFGAPILVSKKLTPENDLMKSYITKRNKEEKSLLSFLLGAEVKYEINRFNFISGINYSSFKEKTEYTVEISKGTRTEVVRDTIFDPNTGKTTIRERSVNVPVYVPSIQNENSRLRYIDIPVLFGYKFGGDNTFTFDVLTGMSFSYLTRAKGNIMAPYELTPGTKMRIPYSTLDLENKEESPLRQSSLNLLLRVGCAYKVNNKWSLVLRPSMKYNLGSVLKKELPYGQKFFIFGLNSGINYKF